jgi:serine/threonine-protein kinase
VAELPAIVAEAAAIARRREARPAAVPPEAAVAGRTKLLVLDDDEGTHAAVEMSAGDLAEIIHATSPVDALQILDREEIGVILAERMLGSMDLTHLLCLLKRQHPQIVSIVLTESMDSKLIARLINEGQIHRFIPKPVKAGTLRLTLKSALERRAELLANPALGERYRPAVPAAGELAAPPSASAATATGMAGPAAGSLFGQLGGLVRRLWGE